jgi:tetratricopeptide (TPR) repeat protein
MRIALCVVAALSLASAQTPPANRPATARAPSSIAPDPAKVASLLETGRCPEALPQARSAYAHSAEKDLKRRLGGGAVRCAVSLNQTSIAVDFIQLLNRDFPNDPEVLYLTVHTYSDLSLRASQTLLFTHPDAYQVHELNAESLETQGKWDEAAEEYRVILRQDPTVPGIHYRLGRAILSKPETPATHADARKEFELELAGNPSNAGAEFVLGELARQDEKYPEAIERFTRATALDVSFADAYIGLGRSLLAAGKAADAVPALETAARLQPANPTTHFLLANAYRRVGRQADADREVEAHRATSEKANQTTEELKKAVSGAAGKVQ